MSQSGNDEPQLDEQGNLTNVNHGRQDQPNRHNFFHDHHRDANDYLCLSDVAISQMRDRL